MAGNSRWLVYLEILRNFETIFSNILEFLRNRTKKLTGCCRFSLRGIIKFQFHIAIPLGSPWSRCRAWRRWPPCSSRASPARSAASPGSFRVGLRRSNMPGLRAEARWSYFLFTVFFVFLQSKRRQKEVPFLKLISRIVEQHVSKNLMKFSQHSSITDKKILWWTPLVKLFRNDNKKRRSASTKSKAGEAQQPRFFGGRLKVGIHTTPHSNFRRQMASRCEARRGPLLFGSSR